MHRGGRTAAPTLWTRKNPRNRTVPGISRLWVKNSVKRNPFQPFFRIKKYKKYTQPFVSNARTYTRDTHSEISLRISRDEQNNGSMHNHRRRCKRRNERRHFCQLRAGKQKMSKLRQTEETDKEQERKIFSACAGYPACRKTLPVGIDMIEEYFYRNSKKGQHCVQCGYSLEAKAGKYGVYVQCCGAQRHKYKLDEI